MAGTAWLVSTLLRPPLPGLTRRNSPPAPAVLRVAGRRLGEAVVVAASRGYNVQITVDENEGEESLFRRFQREVMKAGVLQEVRRRRRHENSRDKIKRKKREAGRRNRRRRMLGEPRIPEMDEDPDAVRVSRDDDDDNWQIPRAGVY